jgi:hypothetical protein
VEYFSQGLSPVHYLPILTTVFSALFLLDIGSRYRRKGGRHLLWWSLGVFTYGLGTFLESVITLIGNGPYLNKAWYVAGAILGGYPLAQGSVYLHFKRNTANILTGLTLPFIIFASVCVWLSPVNMSLLEAHRPGGASLEWQWVRLLTPIINSYAAVFLIGSALLSAIRFARTADGKYRAIGNSLIAFGAILPGVGGGMAKAGVVEALYIGEFVGIIFIYLGYRLCMKDPATASRSA